MNLFTYRYSASIRFKASSSESTPNFGNPPAHKVSISALIEEAVWRQAFPKRSKKIARPQLDVKANFLIFEV